MLDAGRDRPFPTLAVSMNSPVNEVSACSSYTGREGVWGQRSPSQHTRHRALTALAANAHAGLFIRGLPTAHRSPVNFAEASAQLCVNGTRSFAVMLKLPAFFLSLPFLLVFGSLLLRADLLLRRERPQLTRFDFPDTDKGHQQYHRCPYGFEHAF